MKILFHAVASFWRIKVFWSKLSSLENIIKYNKISFEIHNLTTFAVREQRIVFSIWYMIIFNLNIRLGYKQSNAEICALRITFFNKIIRNHIMLLSSSSSSRCFGFCSLPDFPQLIGEMNSHSQAQANRYYVACEIPLMTIKCRIYVTIIPNVCIGISHSHSSWQYRQMCINTAVDLFSMFPIRTFSIICLATYIWV